MTVINVERDAERLTMTLIAEFDASTERVWQLWDNPRQLERWWGPPGYPATFVDHDLSPGGRATYYMTGPEDEKYHGWWQILEVDAPNYLEIRDGFADDQGNRNSEMPETTTRVAIAAIADGTRMTLTTAFASVEDMEQLVEMGMEEGLTLAVGQIDDVLAEDVISGIG